MHDTKNWHKFFSEFNVYTNSIRLKPFIDAISSVAITDLPILEVGSGSGATARILADMGYSVIASDIDEKVLDDLKKTSYFPDDRLKVEQIDMLNINLKPKSVGVVIHQGLLEHFDDETIVRTLKEQAKVSEWVVFDVPNDRDNEQHYGDERFLSYSHWRFLIEKSGLSVVDYKGRMFPKWAFVFPHAFFINKPGI